ncbi:MAG: ABC transporter permease [Actinomycetota bacterium]|nr:ABC transporter permease [Actinomycetota bacterium]
MSTILTRLGTAAITLLLASFFVFFAVQALPGDVAEQLLGQNATDEAVATLRDQLGLDSNVWVRYLEWLRNAVTGDFGDSLVSGEPVAATIWTAFSHTLLIAVPAIVVGITLSLLLGVLAGTRRSTGTDSAISVIALLAMSVPEFVVATVLVLALAILLPVFPAVVLEGSAATTVDLVPAAVLPALTLVIAMAAYVIRAMRSSTIDVLTAEFATTAELKGVTRRRLLWRHVLPQAILPVLPVISINVAWLLGGVVVVESVFNYPGLGKLMIDSVSTRDLPVLEAIAVLSALVYVVVNLLADLLALAADPRQRTLSRRARRRSEPAAEAAATAGTEVAR